MRMPSSRSSAMTRDPSSMPNRRRNLAGMTTVPRLPTLLVSTAAMATPSCNGTSEMQTPFDAAAHRPANTAATWACPPEQARARGSGPHPRPRASTRELPERPAPYHLDRKPFDLAGQPFPGCRVICVQVDRQHVPPRVVLLHPHATDPRLLQQPGGVATLDGTDLFLALHVTSPSLRRPSQVPANRADAASSHAGVTVRACRASCKWLAIV